MNGLARMPSLRKCGIRLFLAMALLAVGVSAQADILFTTIPADGVVGGPAGSTLGWGYTITNNESFDLLIYGIDTSLSANGSPDTFVFDFPYILAGNTVTVPYVPGSSGLFEFTWNPGLPEGTTETGVINLYGFLFDDNFSEFQLSADYTAVVAGQVPEPGAMPLLASGLAGLFGYGRRRFKR